MRKDEPARERAYRRLYLNTKLQFDRIEDVISLFNTQLNALHERIRLLETKNVKIDTKDSGPADRIGAGSLRASSSVAPAARAPG